MNEQVQKPDSDWSIASYAFQVFLTDYYRRGQTNYKLDFDTLRLFGSHTACNL